MNTLSSKTLSVTDRWALHAPARSAVEHVGDLDAYRFAYRLVDGVLAVFLLYFFVLVAWACSQEGGVTNYSYSVTENVNVEAEIYPDVLEAGVAGGLGRIFETNQVVLSNQFAEADSYGTNYLTQMSNALPMAAINSLTGIASAVSLVVTNTSSLFMALQNPIGSSETNEWWRFYLVTPSVAAGMTSACVRVLVPVDGLRTRDVPEGARGVLRSVRKFVYWAECFIALIGAIMIALKMFGAPVAEGG